MNIIEIVILGLALSLDALIVSFSYGLVINSERLKNALILSFSFGFFQFLMPVLGWHFTSLFYKYLEDYSKWIVFVVFMALAFKFLKESFNEEENDIKSISILCILTLSVATSIDAFGAGILLRFLNVNAIIPSLAIGLITLSLSFTGFYIAEIFKKIPAKIVGVVSALLLIYLAIKGIL